jgi:putative ABC transport system ATP-binding protein
MAETKGTILIVDDEESIRDLLSLKLKGDGYDYDVAADGNEALWKLFMKDFDLVLLDIKMPGLTGMEVLSRLIIDHPDISVIMITALLDTEIAVEAMRQGAYDYLIKPFKLNDLGARIEKALEKRRLVLENKAYQHRLSQKIKQLEEQYHQSQSAGQGDHGCITTGQEYAIKSRGYSSPIEPSSAKTPPLSDSKSVVTWGDRNPAANRATQTIVRESGASASLPEKKDNKSLALNSHQKKSAMDPNTSAEIIVRLENVSRTYSMGKSEIKALKNVTLDIAKGELIVILGPSGSGKTTLLNLVGGIDLPSSGRIIANGIDLSAQDDKGLTKYRRNQIGFVFQSFNLITTLTARENVEFTADLVKVPKNTLEVLEMVGLKERTNHYPSELSGGEQQRVAIARAMVKNPEILLCDEPTGELDCETGKLVLSALHMVNRMDRKTVLIVSHNTTIGDMADRVIELRSGEIFEIRTNQSPTDPFELRW